MASDVSHPPKPRKEIKEADQRYRRSQRHLLEECTPGAAYNLPAGDQAIGIVAQAMEAEGLLQRIQDGRFVLTAKGQARRNALRRWSWHQWMLENAPWLVPTFVALCSVIVALATAIND